MLAAYWLVLFAGSHIPQAAPPPAGISLDKVVHLTAYGLLSLMLCFCLGKSGWWRGLSTALSVWLVVCAYGIFDEVTQPYFNRSYELYDLIADSIGGAFGTTLYVVLRKLLRRR